MAQTKRRSPCKHARRRLITTWMDDELSGNTTWGRMSISFNVLGYLLNMKGGGWEYIRRPQSPEEFVIKRPPKNMRSLELLAFALNASALLLLAQGSQRSKDGVYTGAVQRLSAPDRPTAYHLPTYMMHLYRNFRSNFSRPLDTLEQKAAQHADTVQSVMAKSKILFHLPPQSPRAFYSTSWLCTKKIRAYSLGLVRTCPVWHKWRPVKAAAVPDDHRGSESTSRTTSHISGGWITMKGSACEILLSNSQSKPPFSLNTWCWLDISPDAPLYKSLVKSNQQLPSVLFSHLAWLD